MYREVPKVLAAHRSYGRVLILSKTPSSRWGIVYLDSAGRALLGPPFQITAAKGY